MALGRLERDRTMVPVTHAEAEAVVAIDAVTEANDEMVGPPERVVDALDEGATAVAELRGETELSEVVATVPVIVGVTEGTSLRDGVVDVVIDVEGVTVIVTGAENVKLALTLTVAVTVAVVEADAAPVSESVAVSLAEGVGNLFVGETDSEPVIEAVAVSALLSEAAPVKVATEADAKPERVAAPVIELV